jgi:hypothetical protein
MSRAQKTPVELRAFGVDDPIAVVGKTGSVDPDLTGASR